MIIWILFGIITGTVAIWFAPRSSSILGTLILGVLGATLGGILGTILFTEQTSSLNFPLMLIALFGAILLVTLQRSILKN